MVSSDPDRFDVRGKLGAGGMGIVYRAWDRQHQTEVALKVLRSASGRDLYRFKREFRALADIVHPNLLTPYELQTADDEWFFTMELIEGCSFIEWVRAQPTRLDDAFYQLCDGVFALHQLGMLHRDLKPSNVRVDRAGRVVCSG